MSEDLNFENIVTYLAKNYEDSFITEKDLVKYVESLRQRAEDIISILLKTGVLQKVYGRKYIISKEAVSYWDKNA